MFLHYSPFWLKAFYPRYTWHIPVQEKKIFLTFDDGPIPDVTEFVLDELTRFGAKATFFCIGDNVRKHPEVFSKLVQQGHSIGNHTFNHINGWKTDGDLYMNNIRMCDDQLDLPTNLFRPPYGRITKAQARMLPAERKIVMWDVLSGDFSPKLSPQTCLAKSIEHTRPGSIILFHDSIKASKNMQHTLPRFLAHFAQQGYQFDAIPMTN
ncbi:MAG TPA: polysaccharide deacetylase family protein [Dyadobacter sp.]|jgi:peptidoglycan/xylan/chitin deacetylase (PgdA/CDA1 family)|nr:polysaccharide deacetylase family protein [Dyadobacter sp.]